MIHKTPPEKIKEYEDSRSEGKISQSRLKLLPLGVEVFNEVKSEKEAEMFFSEKGYFIIGSAVDCILTESHTVFQEKYHLADCKKPSDTIMSIVQQIFDIECRVTEGFPAEDIYQAEPDHVMSAIDFHGYQANWKPETRFNKILSEGKVYYEELYKSLGKTLLSLDQAAIITAITESILNNPMTAEPFKEALHPEGIDYYHQLIIYFTYREVEMGVLLDILRVDHNNKTLKVVDFKTMGESTIKFPSVMRQRRYDFQIVLYSMALSHWKRQNPAFLDYTILNPGFIVETTAPGKQGNPLVYSITDQVRDIAIHGMQKQEVGSSGDRGITLLGQKVWGIDETVDLYKWHLEHGFEKDKVVVESRGHLQLNWEGVVTNGNTAK